MSYELWVRGKFVKLMSREGVSCEVWGMRYELEGDEGHGLKTALLD